MTRLSIILALMLAATPVLASDLAPPNVMPADSDGNFSVTLHVATVADAVKQNDLWADAAAQVRPFSSIVSTTTTRTGGGFDITYKYIAKH